MKCIGFVGSSCKIEMVQYIAKILNSFNKNVIIIDATKNQKTRFTIPTIIGMESQSQYIVQYDNIDVAVGFSNMLELKKYMLGKGEDFNNYDYLLVDTDSEEMIEEYDLKSANNLFFVSSYDKYAIQKGIELLRFISSSKRRADPDGVLLIDKLLYYSEINSADSKYIDSLAENLPITWGKTHNFPYDQGDLTINIQNQYALKIDIRYLSKAYKAALENVIKDISGEEVASIRKVMKSVERNARF